MSLFSFCLLCTSMALCAATDDDVKYGIIFDAGSSGTRIHVYSFRLRPSFELIADDLLKRKPGLSSFDSNTQGAGSSLQPLLDYAYARIPEERRSATPALLMATAGLRLVGELKAEQILNSVRRTLQGSGFLFQQEWAYILPGEDEGVFGWVTVNYLLGKFASQERAETTAVMDLGGGSVQVVFEPADATEGGASFTETEVSGTQFHTYVHSHLGYGLDQARQKAVAHVDKQAAVEGGAREHPCYAAGHEFEASVEGGAVQVRGTADWQKCLDLVGTLFPVTPCAYSKCSIKGVYQPPLPQHVYAFSYFFDRTTAIGLIDGQPKQYGQQEMTPEKVKTAAQALCSLTTEEVDARFSSHPDASKRYNFCFDAAYVAVVLTEGFGMAPEAPIVMANKIKDVELVWTLGAMVAKAKFAAGEQKTGWGTLLFVFAAVSVGLSALMRMRSQTPGAGSAYSVVSKDRL